MRMRCCVDFRNSKNKDKVKSWQRRQKLRQPEKKSFNASKKKKSKDAQKKNMLKTSEMNYTNRNSKNKLE